MEALVLVVAEPAEATSAQAARVLDTVVKEVLTRPIEQFVTSPVAGVLATGTDVIVPVLPVEGIPTRLDPDDPQTLDEIVDYLYRSRGSGYRRHLDTLIEKRRVALTAAYTGDTPASEPGVPPSAPPISSAARNAELVALERLVRAAAAASDRLNLRLGVLLDYVDTSARNVMHQEIEKARELAAYTRYGLISDESTGDVTVADPPDVFTRLADGLRTLALRREQLRTAEAVETVAELGVFAAVLRYLSHGEGTVFEDPGAQMTGERERDAARDRIAAANAYGSELRSLATTFPLAWHLDDNLSSAASNDTVLEWVKNELRRTHEALDEIHTGAVLRDPPVFTTQDPLATVLDDARSSWSVWQYAQVVSLGLARSNQTPGSLAWCAAMEALGRIAEQRAPREEDHGWLFTACLQVALFIPVIGEIVAVFDVLVAAVSAYQRIAEAEHQRTAHLAALDPVSVLAVPDVPLGAVVFGSLLRVGLSLFAASRMTRLTGLVDVQYYANRTLYACRQFCLGLWFLGSATGGGSMQIAYRNPAVAALVEANQRGAIRELGEIFLEIRVGSESAAAAGAAAQASGQAAEAARVVVDQEIQRLVASLTAMTGTAVAEAGQLTGTGPLATGGAPSSTRGPASGSTSTTQGPAASRSIPDIEQLVQNPALLSQAIDDVTTMLRLAAPGIPDALVENRDFVRVLVLQMLNAYRQYTSTYTLRRQMAEGIPFQEAQTLDVNGIVNYIAGKVNELLAIGERGLTARLMAEATTRYAAAPAGWEYPRLASQLEIDTGNGYRLAQDLGVYSPGTGPNQGLMRLWAWGQITFGDPTHLLTQTDSDFNRLGTAGARIRIDGTEYDVGMQVVGGPPLPGSAAVANTGIIGASTRPPAPDVAAGLAGYGVTSHRLPWTADELRTIVREVLRRANKLGQ